MGGMADGWLPPTAPGAKPPPRFDVPQEQPASEPQPAAPTFARTDTAAPKERNGAAVWAMSLGITGLVLLVLSFGSLFLITLPFSAAAWALAGRARRQIESGATSQGEGQATAALWLGRIGVIAGVAAMVVFIVLLASGVDFEQLRDDLQRELDERRERQGDGGGDGVRTSLEQILAAAGAWVAR
jgi:hypothetical protein